jgi:hypothetical protein
MELYQQITFWMLISALFIRGLKYVFFDKEITLGIISDSIIISAILIFIFLIDVSGLIVFCKRIGIVLIVYSILSICVYIAERQFQKEDNELLND